MAFTKVVGAGIHTLAQLQTHNIHSAGIVTATKFVGEMESGGGDSTFQNVTIAGNLTVNGTTTTLDTDLMGVDKIEVSANNTTVAVAVTQSGSGDLLRLFDSTTEVLRVTDEGRVGIGTDNPTQKLDIRDGNILLDAFNNSGDGGIFFRPGFTVADSNSYNLSILAYDHTAANRDGLSLNAYDGISFCTGSNTRAEKVRIDAAGRVGIGTESPNARLNLKLSARGTADFRITDSDTGNDVLRAGSQADGDGFFQLRTIAGAGNVLLDASGVSYITGGNFGIGETAPDGMLHIKGTVPAIYLEDTSGTHGQTIFEQNDDNLKIRCDAGNASSGTGSNIRFEIDGGEQVRIASGGDVNIGAAAANTTIHASGLFNGATPKFEVKLGAAANSYTRLINITNPGGQTGSESLGRVGIKLSLGSEASSTESNKSGAIYAESTSTYNNATALCLATNNAERLRITSDGNVGINSTSPNAQFVINRSLSENQGIEMGYSASSGGLHFIQAYNRSTSAFTLLKLNNAVSITSAGKVGIGTDNPGSQSSGANNLVVAEFGGEGGITIKNDTNSMGHIFFADTDATAQGRIDYGHSGDYMRFYTANGERLRINSDGEVGIGTDNPGSLVEIYNPSTSGNTVLHVHNDKTGDAAQIRLEGGRTSTNDYGQVLFANRGYANAIILATGSADDGTLLFKTSDTGSGQGMSTYLQIAANGNIKLGKNSQNAPGARFHVEDTNNTDYNAASTTGAVSEYFVNSGTGDCTGILLQNTSTDASNTCQATIHSVAETTNKNTALAFGTRQNSDATTRERMRIDSNGNILIGETTTSYPVDIGYSNDTVYATNAVIGHAVEIHNKSTTAGTSAGIHMYVTGNGANAAAAHLNCVHTANGSGAFTVGTRHDAGNHIERFRIHSHGQLELKVPDANSTLKLTPDGTNAPATIDFNTPGTGPAKLLVQGSERLRIDSTGRIGFGGIDPANYYSTYDDFVWGSTSSSAGMTIVSATDGAGYLTWADGTSGADQYRGRIYYSHGDDGFHFRTNGTAADVLHLKSNQDITVVSGEGKINGRLQATDGSGGYNRTFGCGLIKKNFYIYGDSDKYYPVEIIPYGSSTMTHLAIYRAYSEHGPSDWYTATHKGGLTLEMMTRVGGWGGYTTHGPTIFYLGEVYSTLLGGMAWTAHTQKYVIWLRGGGAGGALYHIESPNGNIAYTVHDDTSHTGTGAGYYYSQHGTAGEGNNSNTIRGWSTYYHATTGYRVYCDYIGNSTTLNAYRAAFAQYNITGAHTTHSGGAHNP